MSPIKKTNNQQSNREQPSYGLITRDLLHIRAAAAELPEIDKIILFGSRAKGTHQQGSDVDLSIRGRKITHSTVLRLSASLNEERPLPYFFDVVDYQGLEAEDPLREHIDRVGIVIFTTPDTSSDIAHTASTLIA